MTVFLLNSAVIAAGAYGTYRYAPATWAELTEALGAAATPEARCQDGPAWPAAIVSRVGYEETARVIWEVTAWRPPLSRETSALAPGDVAWVVRLRYRIADPRAKGQATGARLREDWEVGKLERLT